MKSVLLVLVAFVSVGTVLWAQDVPAAQKIQFGKEVCAQCGMVIQNSGYASEILTLDKKVLKFDDIGDLLKYEGGHADLKVAVVYVQDAKTKAWLKIEDAHWVKTTAVKTPMGWGYHAFSSDSDAMTFSDKTGGAAITLDDLKASVQGGTASTPKMKM